MALKYIIVVLGLLLFEAIFHLVKGASDPIDRPAIIDDSAESSIDDYINSLLKDDAALMNDLKFEARPSDSSGEAISSDNETTVQRVIDLMFHDPFEDDSHTDAPIINEEIQPTTSNDREKKSNSDERKIESQLKRNNDILQEIGDILKRHNTTFNITKDALLLIRGSEAGKQNMIMQICKGSLPDTVRIKSKFPNVAEQEVRKLEELISLIASIDIEPSSLAKSKDNCSDIISDLSTTKTPQFHISQIREFANEGLVEDQLIFDIERGAMSVNEASMKLLTNEQFILAQFPEEFGDMHETNRVPSHIEKILFAGQHSLNELKRKVYNDDAISKALLPERIREILEDRAPPMVLKEMLYEGLNHTEIIHETLGNETLVEDIMSESMFYFYNLFKVQKNVIMNMALSATTIVALVCVMTSLGCTMTVKDIMAHVKRPKGVLIALFSQYGVMPATAFALTQAFDLGVYPAIAVLICGCCPGGNLSNILAFAINGDMNLSILMTTCSSVFGLAMMPLLLYCYSRYIIPIGGAEIVPFDKIILNITLTIVPVSLGITIKHYRPSWTKNIMRFGAVMLLLCSITFSVIAGFLLGDKFFSFFPKSVVLCAAILPITGYILGFILARLVRENQKCSRTISVETGCQNVQLCGTVLKLAFDPVLIGAMMLLPIIYMAFQAGEALLLITIYRLYERWCTKKKNSEDDEEIKFDDEEKKRERRDSEIKERSDDEDGHPVPNGQKKSGCDSNKDSEKGENWPLMSRSDKSLQDVFEDSKENYV